MVKSSRSRGGLMAAGIVVALTAYYVYAKRNHLPPTGTSVRMQSGYATATSDGDDDDDDATAKALANPWNNK